MSHLYQLIARRVMRRGPVAVWEIATVAAVAPVLVNVATSAPYALAAALALSMILLAALREAVGVAIAPAPLLPQNDRAHPSTLPAPIEAIADTGLRVRDTLQQAIEDHDITDGPAFLGLIRFANFRAMMAFDPIAAEDVMQQFGVRLQGAVGAERPVAKVDDDSFAILFAVPQAPESELASIGYVLAQEIDGATLTVLPDIHVGHARLDASVTSVAALLGVAQATLAPLRRVGQIKSATTKPTPESLADHFAIEQALRRAVRAGQLSLRYQPFVDARAVRITGAEALLRWRHPELGEVSPARFIPILEETGLIHEIGLWTLNSACRQLQLWHHAGRTDLRLAINLSAIQLQERSIRLLVERTVASHGLSPADVELELTETAAMEDQQRTADLFKQLRIKGFGIALDDFGSGHSNLSYLKNLPFTKLKIDREFVTHVDSRPGSQAICKALVELGAGLGISILAEGVERREEVSTLRKLGCHTFQGFYFCRPLTADALTVKLTDNAWLVDSARHALRNQEQRSRRVMS